MSKGNRLRDTFRINLRAVRESRGFSQSDLAGRCGLQPSAVAHFEAGRRTPSLHNLVRLCRALGCQSDYLIGLSLAERFPFPRGRAS